MYRLEQETKELWDKIHKSHSCRALILGSCGQISAGVQFDTAGQEARNPRSSYTPGELGFLGKKEAKDVRSLRKCEAGEVFVLVLGTQVELYCVYSRSGPNCLGGWILRPSYSYSDNPRS
jgi:hypothetical protein